MKTRDKLYKTPGYWIEKIENELFRKIYEYMEAEGLNRTQLAERLDFHKSYITQMLNGDLNFSMKKLTELALKIGVVPELKLRKIEEYTAQEEARLSKYNFEDDISRQSLSELDYSLPNVLRLHTIKFANVPITLNPNKEYV